MKIIDLSHAISENMQIYPGDPSPIIKEFLIHDTDYCHVNAIHIGSHTGTHVDAPFHFIKNGKTISDYSPDRFMGEGFVIDVSGKNPNEPILDTDILSYKSAIEPGQFVIFKTGWDYYFGDKKYARHPYLSPDAAKRLVDLNVGLIAIDALNVDPTMENIFPVHEILLGNDVLIVENICNLKSVPKNKGYYSFLPLKFEGADGSPVRAIYFYNERENL